MTRSPLFYPLSRGMDLDAGGVADMQTDVMRFMAILALCLVAIFALVQSIPLAPTVEREAEAPPPPVPKEREPEPVVAEPPPAHAPAPEPAPEPLPEPVETVVAEPAPPPAESQTAATPAPPAPVEPEQQEGFTLHFESDLALTRLVARNEIGLYAITPDRSLRMNVNRGSMSFWPASTPQQFHEMQDTTVPSTVVSALRSSGRSPAGSVQWGVTIPATMSRQLDQYLSEYRSGELIIDADGGLRLENGR